MPLDECKLGGSFSGDEQVELPFLGTYLGDVDVEVANPVNLHSTVSLDGMPQSFGCFLEEPGPYCFPPDVMINRITTPRD